MCNLRRRNGVRNFVGTIAALTLLLAFVAAPVAAQDTAEPTAEPAAEPAAEQSGWVYDAVLYGWFSGMSGTMGVAGIDGDVDATFSDLAGFVDFAMAGHFEARSNKGVFLTDISYVGLGAEREAEIAGQPVDIDMDLNQWIIELGGGWRLTPEFDLLLTGRWYVLDLGSVAESVQNSSSTDANQNWGDLFLAARYSKMLWTNWLVSIRGDIGTGGSDFAWFGEATVGYQFTELFSAVAAGRILSLDHTGGSDDSYFKYDVTQSGLGVGLRFSF